MNLYHLQYFCDALREQSLAKSAKLNRVSPGAVSQAIKSLETFFNTDLIVHQQRLLMPTEKGLELLALGDSLLEDFRLLREKMEDNKTIAGEIYFATQQSIANSFLPGLLKGFKESYPDIVPRFTLGHTSIVQEQLDSRRVGFAITLDNVDFKKCEEESLYEGEFIFLKAKGLRSSNLDFLVTGVTREVGALERDYRVTYKKELPIGMRIDSWGVIKRMVIEGHGIGYVPDFMFTRQDKRLTKVSIDVPRSKYKIKAVWSNKVPMQKPMKVFFEYIKGKL